MEEVKLEPPVDEYPIKEDIQETMDTAEIVEPESELKAEPEQIETEDAIGEDDVQPIAPTTDTTHTAVACSIDGNVKFEDSPKISSGPISGKIKINITKSFASIAAKEPQSEGAVETMVTDQSPDNDDPVSTEANRDSSEEAIGEENVDSQEPPPPGVEPVQLKPRLVGRKLTDLPPVMKGTELSGLCSIM